MLASTVVSPLYIVFLSLLAAFSLLAADLNISTPASIAVLAAANAPMPAPVPTNNLPA